MRAWFAAPLSLLCGCHCGQYTVSGTGYSFDGHPIDGAYFEACGPLKDSTGEWGGLEDGRAFVELRVNASGPRSWNVAFTHMFLSIDLADMVEGNHVDFPALTGTANLTDASGAAFDAVSLTGGSVDVVAQKFDGDICDVARVKPPYGPVFRLAWDVAYGDPSDLYYAGKGEDDIVFDTLYSPECGWAY